jgi:hypothetical protein
MILAIQVAWFVLWQRRSQTGIAGEPADIHDQQQKGSSNNPPAVIDRHQGSNAE